MVQGTLQIFNMDERPFNLRLIRTNQRYGVHGELLHTGEIPLLEFFDASEADDDSDHELGYFTGIRCEASMFFNAAASAGDSTDKLFNEALPVWGITDENVEEIREWLEKRLSEREKHPALTTETVERAISTGSVEIEQVGPVASDSDDLSVHLQQILAMLDDAEQQDGTWREGQIKTRLHIIHAKKHILKALHSFQSNK